MAADWREDLLCCLPFATFVQVIACCCGHSFQCSALFPLLGFRCDVCLLVHVSVWREHLIESIYQTNRWMYKFERRSYMRKDYLHRCIVEARGSAFLVEGLVVTMWCVRCKEKKIASLEKKNKRGQQEWIGGMALRKEKSESTPQLLLQQKANEEKNEGKNRTRRSRPKPEGSNNISKLLLWFKKYVSILFLLQFFSDRSLRFSQLHGNEKVCVRVYGCG